MEKFWWHIKQFFVWLGFSVNIFLFCSGHPNWDVKNGSAFWLDGQTKNWVFKKIWIKSESISFHMFNLDKCKIIQKWTLVRWKSVFCHFYVHLFEFCGETRPVLVGYKNCRVWNFFLSLDSRLWVYFLVTCIKVNDIDDSTVWY